MADEPTPDPTPEPEPQDPNAALRDAVRSVLNDILSEPAPAAPPKPSQGGSFQGIAALEAEAPNNPAAKFILDLAGTVAQQQAEITTLRQRVNAGPKIAPERLADAEKEFATGRYASLEDADAAAYGRKVLSGQAAVPRPAPRQVQTAVASPPQVQSVAEAKELTASEYNAALQGPERLKVWQRRKEGKLVVVPD